jgi:hypothetical protein
LVLNGCGHSFGYPIDILGLKRSPLPDSVGLYRVDELNTVQSRELFVRPVGELCVTEGCVLAVGIEFCDLFSSVLEKMVSHFLLLRSRVGLVPESNVLFVCVLVLQGDPWLVNQTRGEEDSERKKEEK